MKKVFLMFVLYFMAFTFVSAEKKDVIIDTGSRNNSEQGNQPSRGPIHSPRVSIEDYTLFFDSSCTGCNIDLLQGDVIVYSDVVDENGEILLPSNLSGVYQLQLQFGSITFVGDIEL